MTSSLPPLSLERIDPDDCPAEGLPTWWTHSFTFFRLGGRVVVGHKLTVESWAGELPCWAAPGSVVAKLAGQAPRNVLRVHGWASDGASTTTAFVVTDLPPIETLQSILERGVQKLHLASHSLTLSVLAAVVWGLDQMRNLGITVGSLHPMTVFVELPSPQKAPDDSNNKDGGVHPSAVFLDPLYSIVCSAPRNKIPALDKRYLAPEIVSSESANLTWESDLYAFGVLAWVVIHHPGVPIWFSNPNAERKRLRVDPSLVPSTVLVESVELCTEPDPKTRHVGPSILTNIPNLLLLSANRDRCLNSNHVELTAMIGQGGFGKVYSGLLDGFRVVVKVIGGQGGTPYVCVDAFRELSFTTSLSHPNIAEVYGWVEKGPELWLVMKFYPMGNLEDWLRARYEEKKLQPTPAAEGGPFGWDVFFDVSIGIARALVYLAGRNLVHRDVKPSNILLEWLPTDQHAKDHLDVPVLSDFGLGRRLLGKEPEFTSRAVGTNHYAAPEVATLGLFPLSAKADVYSFGAVMKQLLQWRPRSVGQKPTWDPPTAVHSLVDSCLQHNPEDRPGARELLDQLGRLRIGITHPAAVPK